MSGIFILDTCFLHSLAELDSYCRTQQFRPPKSHQELPFAGLNHLLNKGQILVLPNEVLREGTFNSSGRMGMRWQHGTLGIDMDALHHCPFRGIPELIQAQAKAGRIEYFDSTEEFNAMARRGDLDGKLCVVADQPIADSTKGREQHTRLNKASENTTHSSIKSSLGDQEIMRLYRAVHNADRPSIVLTNDRNLTGKLREERRGYTFGIGGFLKVLSVSGFVQNDRTFPILMQRLAHEKGRDASLATPPQAGDIIDNLWKRVAPAESLRRA